MKTDGATEPADRPADDATGGGGFLVPALWAGAGLCVLATGLVLWNARGAAVFTDVLSAAIAWCF